MKKLVYGLLALLAVNSIQAQNNWCGSNAYNEALQNSLSAEERAENKEIRDQIFHDANWGNQKESNDVITIPVVVHVFHDNCQGNISKEQILDGIRVLNEDYARKNADTSQTRALFKPVAGTPRIQFKLAQIDPDGNCTEGIVRVNTPVTNDFPINDWQAVSAAKSISQWGYGDSRKYMNVWLVRSIESSGPGMILGYATYPTNQERISYGLVVRSDNWGTIGTSNADGRTATHEMGHALELPHTFDGNGCGGNCDNSGDQICDTPPSYEATYGCNNTQNTCSNDANISASAPSWKTPNPYTSNVVDQIENYMSYDHCQNMFTKQQTYVMRNSLESYTSLIKLVSQSNLAATGTDSAFIPSPCRPIAQVCQQEVQICAGGSVTFADQSYNGQVSNRNWTFSGGNPATSTDSMVTVTYTKPGVYNVVLNAGNSVGNSVKTLQNIVTVLSSQSQLESWRYSEDFDDKDAFDTLWSVEDDGGVKWERTNKASVSNEYSVYLRNYINQEDKVDVLYSPTYNIADVYQPRFSFKVAYARRSSASNDFLNIYYTYNCGENWSYVGVLAGVLMESTSGFVGGEFTPKDNEWRTISYGLSSILKDKENVRFKFEFVSGGGNNIYIDDLNIESATGIEEHNPFDAIAIYPNPASDDLFVDFSQSVEMPNNLKLMDMSGRVLINRSQLNSSASGKLMLDVSEISAGIYFIEFTGNSGERSVQKVVIR